MPSRAFGPNRVASGDEKQKRVREERTSSAVARRQPRQAAEDTERG
jgi:hypothetical protein